MADPLTAVGGVAAASQLAGQIVKVTSVLVELYGKIQDAPETIRKQMVHIEQLAVIMRLVVRNEGLQTHIVASVLGSMFQVVEELRNILQKSMAKAEDSSLYKIGKALTAVMKDKEIAKLFQELEKEKVLLALCIHELDSQLLQSIDIEITKTALAVDTVSAELKDVSRNVTSIVSSLPAIGDDVELMRTVLADLDCKVMTIFNDIPAMSKSLENIHTELQRLPGILQDLMATQPRPESVVSKSSRLTGHFTVPNRLARNFLGREDLLSKIDKALSPSSQQQKVVVIRGMGGQGKTQVALRYCQLHQNSPFQSIFWLDASSERSLKGSFESISELLKMSTDYLSSSESRISFVLRELATAFEPWLLIFDNYDDVDSFGNVLDYFPHCDQGAVIVTSRHVGSSELTDSSDCDIELKALEEESAVSLLLQQSGAERSESTTSDALQIVQRLGYHALAISQAGAYMKQRKIGLGKFMEHYSHRRRKILETTPRLSQYRRKLDNDEKETLLNVFTTLELSFQQLELVSTGSGLEAQFLSLLALFDCNDISEEILMACPWRDISRSNIDFLKIFEHFYTGEKWDSDLYAENLKPLMELSLIQNTTVVQDGPCHVRLHPLIKDWLKVRTDRSTSEEMTQVITILIAAFLQDSFSDEEWRLPLVVKHTLMAHILEYQSNLSELFENYPQSFYDTWSEMLRHGIFHIANFSHTMGQYNIAEKLYCVLESIERIRLGQEHVDTLSTMAKLSETYMSLGWFNEAETLQLNLLEIYKRVLGDEHSDTLHSMAGLASIYWHQKRLDEAEELELHVVEIRKQILGEEHLATLTALHNLAATYLYKGRPDDAIPILEQVLEARKRLLQPEDPLILSSMSTLGRAYWAEDRLDEAIELGEYVLRTSQRVLGVNHPKTLFRMMHLAYALHDSGELTAAISLLEEAREKLLMTMGPGHPETEGCISILRSWHDMSSDSAAEEQRNEEQVKHHAEAAELVSESI